MKRVFAITALLLSFGSFAKDNPSTTQFFTAEGKPTSAVQSWVSLAGLKLVKGREILFPNDLLDKGINGCVTVAVQVGKDGVPSHYTALDAIAFDEKSRKDAVAAVIASLSDWRFEPTDRLRAFALPISFTLAPERRGEGRIISAAPPVICARPSALLQLTDEAEAGVSGLPVSYPFPASPGRESGCVLLGFDVMENGLADGYEIVASDDTLPERFIAATVANANQWRFSCRVKTDTPVCSMPFPPTDPAPASAP